MNIFQFHNFSTICKIYCWEGLILENLQKIFIYTQWLTHHSDPLQPRPTLYPWVTYHSYSLQPVPTGLSQSGISLSQILTQRAARKPNYLAYETRRTVIFVDGKLMLNNNLIDK